MRNNTYIPQTASSKGQVTIPVAIRRKLGIKAGSSVRFVQRGGEVLLEKVESDVSSVFGMLKAKSGQSLEQLKQAVIDESAARHARK